MSPLSADDGGANNGAASSAFDYLDSGPFCMVVLEQQGQDEYFAVKQINETFERQLSPMFKLTGVNFLTLATHGHRQALRTAIETAITSNDQYRARARNIEMTTLAECNSGLPIKRHFDWTVGTGKDGQLLLFGDPCSDGDVEQRAKDVELIDFFQNAPIALHWLSGDGIVLWANQTELDVLGYTAEEYIGQPIMKFCPDEEELVLEIFKQLGSGNAIADVPVRFRTKDGRIVDLLIDSNVKYDDQGKFAHTRCFIRDDTKRKVREARANLLLVETKRSLTMLDNFMSRSLHHMRTPLHVLQTTVDIVLEYVAQIAESMPEDPGLLELVDESKDLLTQAGEHVSQAVEMIDDISDLARLDQGSELKISRDLIQLRDLGQDVFASIDVPSKVEVALELQGGGPQFIHSDARFLKKIICHLLDHAATVEHPDDGWRTVTLNISHTADRCLFSVMDAGDDAPADVLLLESEPDSNSTELPVIFQRYHQEVLPAEIVDFEAAGSLRDKIESGINSARNNSVGLGLSLSYHLVMALGGDLRYSSRPNVSKFWFSLPHNNEELESERIVLSQPKPVQGNRFLEMEQSEKDAFPFTKTKLASDGLKAMELPSILVVEDVPMCAKLICTILRQFNCPTKWVKNGKDAVDLLRKEPGVYSLILMDLKMPIMDGLTATKIIKDELRLEVPVVALTGEGGDGTQELCTEFGCDAYYNKPMKRDQLIRVIQEQTGYVVNDIKGGSPAEAA